MYKYLHTSIQIWLRHVNSSLWEVCDITRIRSCKNGQYLENCYTFTTLKFNSCGRIWVQISLLATNSTTQHHGDVATVNVNQAVKVWLAGWHGPFGLLGSCASETNGNANSITIWLNVTELFGFSMGIKSDYRFPNYKGQIQNILLQWW